MVSSVRAAITAAEASARLKGEPVYSSEFLAATAAAKTSGNTESDRNDYPEIDCLRSLLPSRVLSDAEDRAGRLSIGADRVLIASGAIDEETYLRHLGATLGIPIKTLTDVPRSLCSLTDKRLLACDSDGLLALAIDNDVVLILAPRETQARWLVRLIRRHPSLAGHLRLTTCEQLSQFILRCTEQTLLTDAIDSLKQRWPELSAGPPRRLSQCVTAVVTLTLLISVTSYLTHLSIFTILEAMLTIFFLAWSLLRLVCVGMEWRKEPETALPDVTDASLPVYSIIVALYKEAKSVDKLLRNFEGLDYPHEKLDIILAIEADDDATRAAIAARTTRIPIRIITCPNAQPRTKPKALNVALPFARGDFTVIYDAEDLPDKAQLRRALQAFHAGGDDLICVQARLCIDNTEDSWLTKFFTVEYAGHFEIFLTALAKLGLPLPLGGSSNHFRTDKLREIGAWDPYNVTEDADLGMRLTRFGYRASVIHSMTSEEAPAHYPAWLRQRTRWFKGWMQTWAVHMRHPISLVRELGAAGFFTFQLIVGGSVFAALVHPLFIVYLIVATLYDWFIEQFHAASLLFTLFILFFGYVTSALIGWRGLARYELTSTSSILLATPVHWFQLTHAAYRALHKFIFNLYEWEKTEHGLAKTSRSDGRTVRTLLGLSHWLDDLKRRRRLPSLSIEAKSHSQWRSNSGIASLVKTDNPASSRKHKGHNTRQTRTRGQRAHTPNAPNADT